jgi:hypothetical protein
MENVDSLEARTALWSGHEYQLTLAFLLVSLSATKDTFVTPLAEALAETFLLKRRSSQGRSASGVCGDPGHPLIAF